jgi:hypothetical protein
MSNDDFGDLEMTIGEAIEYAATNLPEPHKYWIELRIERGSASLTLYFYGVILDSSTVDCDETLGEAVRRLVEVARKHAENEL